VRHKQILGGCEGRVGNSFVRADRRCREGKKTGATLCAGVVPVSAKTISAGALKDQG
jgi:hypothetical protein